MSSGNPWYKRYPSDFIAGTLGMTLEEKGAYSIVLDLIYDRGRPVPDDPRYLAGVCGCSVRKWNALRQRLVDLGKIVCEGGTISNRRAEKEIETAAKIARKLAENGAKGGNKKAENAAAASESKDLDVAEPELTRVLQKPEAREEKKEPHPPSGDTPLFAGTGPPAKQATRLPSDWWPGDAEVEFARSMGFTDAEITATAEVFRDSWCAKGGAAGRKADWLATWRNWVRRDAEDGRRGPKAHAAQAGRNGRGPASYVGVALRRIGAAQLPDRLS